MAYAAAGGYAPPDRGLCLPRDRAEGPARREKCHVPEGVESRGGWRVAADLIERSRPGLPHGWVAGDDEFGRPARSRSRRRRRGERYILDVPSDTVVRDLGCGRPGRRAGRGARPQVASCRADARAARQPGGRRTRPKIRAGEKGPLWVDAMALRVRTESDRRLGPEERPVVVGAVEAKPEVHYALSHAGPEVGWKGRCGPGPPGIVSRRCSGRARERSGRVSTKCGVGWGGTAA